MSIAPISLALYDSSMSAVCGWRSANVSHTPPRYRPWISVPCRVLQLFTVEPDRTL